MNAREVMNNDGCNRGITSPLSISIFVYRLFCDVGREYVRMWCDLFHDFIVFVTEFIVPRI